MISTIKNDFLDFDVYPSGAVFTEFKKKFGESLDVKLQNDPTNMEAFAFAIYIGHKSVCKIKNVEEKVSFEDILYKMTMTDLAEALPKVLPSSDDSQKKMK